MNTTMIFVLIGAIVIIFAQYVFYFRKVGKLERENVKLDEKYHELYKQYYSLRNLSNEKPDLSKISFTYKDGTDIGNKSVKIKKTPTGAKFYTRAKRAEKFTDVEVFPKY